MAISLTEDICSVAELKRSTADSRPSAQDRATGDSEGKADAVLIDAKIFEKHLKASNLKLLVQGEEDIAAGRTREMGQVLREFKHARKIPG
jgi:hypothetical protein